MSAPLFHVLLSCSACGSRLVVNLNGLTARRAEQLSQALAVADCGACKAHAMHGDVRPGHSPEAKMVVKDGPVTWDPKVVQDLLARSKT